VTLAAAVLQGASGRLLPASVPLRFFVMAVAAHIAFWAALCATADQLAGFRGGFAPLLAAVHLLTIGVLVSTAIGAAVQILPVVTRRPLAAVWPVKLVFWLLLPGLVLLVVGFYAARPGVASAGSAAAAAALLLFAAVLGDTLRRATGPPVVVAYGWAALVALVATVVLGLRLIGDFRWGGGQGHGALALGHLILGGFGCMGLFALGFSHVLVPMFTLAGVPDRRLSWAGFATATLAVVLGAVGATARVPRLLPLGAALGVVACGLYLWLMRQALRDGMRRRLGLSFVLVRVAWVLQATTLAGGLACALGAPGTRGAALFAVLLFVGWLLTFLLAVLQRILPMLASMHVAAGVRQAPGFAADSPRGLPLRLHACCHGLAFVAICAGVAADVTALVRIGSVLGLFGACAFAVFTFGVLSGLGRGGARNAAAAAGRPAA
jgi:hypothetical protein